MSEDLLFFAVGTVGRSTLNGRKSSTLLGAARHNARLIQAEQGGRSNIDASRTLLNEVLAGPTSPEDVVALAHALMSAAGAPIKKLRKDHVQAIELVFSLPADTTIDTGGYFRRCVTWAETQFGIDNLLSAIVHRDEANPHIHILFAPLKNGRVCGGELLKRQRTRKLYESFALEVAKDFGLKLPVPIIGEMRGIAIQMIYERLESLRDPILQSCLLDSIRRTIERNPGPTVAALGIVLPESKAPAKKVKKFVDYVTSHGKGPRVERERKPLGFEVLKRPNAIKASIPSCVGFTPEPPPPAPPLIDTKPLPDQQVPDVIRVRDRDLDPALYDETTGEFFQRPPPAPSKRATAEAWVTEL